MIIVLRKGMCLFFVLCHFKRKNYFKNDIAQNLQQTGFQYLETGRNEGKMNQLIT